MLTIFSKENCQQCDSAKLLCQMKGAAFETKLLGSDYSKDDLMTIAPKARSFPVVFYGETLIGGLIELKEFLKK
jgi:glutaredoxin